MIDITREPIDPSKITDLVRSNQAGAVCSFLGTVREMTGGRQTVMLEYEAYPEMARKTLADLEAEARSRWPVVELALVHRVGRLDLGEIAVVVAVSCPHRDQAFEACRWLIDTVKEVVPIWKKEVWADGTREWVHPGAGSGGGGPYVQPEASRIESTREDEGGGGDRGDGVHGERLLPGLAGTDQTSP